MDRFRSVCFSGLAAMMVCAGVMAGAPAAAAQTPDVGSNAPDFTLSTPEDTPVRLSSLLAKGTVVLIVLRGYPGYQCPFCQKQAHEFEVNADKFAAAGAQILLVYPGMATKLRDHAREFLGQERTLPTNYHLVLDPDFKFTNQYGLRWQAEEETAYPSTFLIDRKGTVVFSKISHSHGDRTTVEEMLAELGKAK